MKRALIIGIFSLFPLSEVAAAYEVKGGGSAYMNYEFSNPPQSGLKEMSFYTTIEGPEEINTLAGTWGHQFYFEKGDVEGFIGRRAGVVRFTLQGKDISSTESSCHRRSATLVDCYVPFFLYSVGKKYQFKVHEVKEGSWSAEIIDTQSARSTHLGTIQIAGDAKLKGEGKSIVELPNTLANCQVTPYTQTSFFAPTAEEGKLSSHYTQAGVNEPEKGHADCRKNLHATLGAHGSTAALVTQPTAQVAKWPDSFSIYAGNGAKNHCLTAHPLGGSSTMLWSCVQTAGQDWVVQDQTIRIQGELCLTGTDDSYATITPCECGTAQGKLQLWEIKKDAGHYSHIRNLSSGKCLTVSEKLGELATLGSCTAFNTQWDITASTITDEEPEQQEAKVVSSGLLVNKDYCASVYSSALYKEFICTKKDDLISWYSDNTLRTVAGECLTANGHDISLAPCEHLAEQIWIYKNFNFMNKNNDLCLNSETSYITLSACSEHWTLLT